MYFHAFLQPAHRPLVDAAELAVARIAVDADVHVVVVRLGVAWLAQDVGGAREHGRIFARGGSLAEQQRRQIVLDEDPLHLRARILDERAHQRPVALAVEAIVGHRPIGRLLPARRRPAHRAALGVEAQHRVAGLAPGGRRRRARNRRCRRRVRCGGICARSRRPRPAARDRRSRRRRPASRASTDAGRARDQPDQLFGAVVAVARAPVRRNDVAVAGDRQHHRRA